MVRPPLPGRPAAGGDRGDSPTAGEGPLRFRAGFGDGGGPRRHHVADAVIEAVLAAHDQVRAGEALRPDRVLDEGGAAAGAESVANCRGGGGGGWRAGVA